MRYQDIAKVAGVNSGGLFFANSLPATNRWQKFSRDLMALTEGRIKEAILEGDLLP